MLSLTRDHREHYDLKIMKLLLAQYALGRILLHLGCMVRGSKTGFHLTGIRRELAHLRSLSRRQ